MFVEIRQIEGPLSFTGNEFSAEYERARYLGAFLDDEPVGQVCHVFDGICWWTEQLCVRPDMRQMGLALKLIEANYHYAIDNGITMLLARTRKNHGVSPQTFERNDSRMRLGSDRTLTHNMHGCLYVRRSLKPLVESIERGEVDRIKFPYRFMLFEQAKSA